MAPFESVPKNGMPRVLELLQESFPSPEKIRRKFGSLVSDYICQPMTALRTYLCTSVSGRHIWPAEASVFEGVDYERLLTWLEKHVIDEKFQKANVIQIVSGNRDLADIDHYKYTARLQAGRTAWSSCSDGYTEKWHLVFLKFGEDSGLSTMHYTWAMVPALHALMLRFPDKGFVCLDDDSAFLTLFNMADLRKLARKAYHALNPELYEANNFRPGILNSWRPGIYTCSDESVDVNAGFTIHPRADAFPTHDAWLAYARLNGHQTDGKLDWNQWFALIQCHKVFFTQQNAELHLDQFSGKSDEHSSWRKWQAAAKASLLEGTPFYGRFAHSSLDYVVAWLLLGEVINKCFHPVPATGKKHGRLGNVAKGSDFLQRAVPPIERWGSCTFEQTPLAALHALSHPDAYYVTLPGELLFMHQNIDTSDTCVVPAVVHAYGAGLQAKPKLKRLDNIKAWPLLQDSCRGLGDKPPAFCRRSGTEQTFSTGLGPNVIASFRYTHQHVNPRRDQRWSQGEVSCSEIIADYLQTEKIEKVVLPLLRASLKVANVGKDPSLEKRDTPFIIHGLGLDGKALPLAPAADLVLRNGGTCRTRKYSLSEAELDVDDKIPHHNLTSNLSQFALMLREEIMQKAWTDLGYTPKWASARVRPMPAHLHNVSFANALGVVILLDFLLQFHAQTAFELHGWSAGSYSMAWLNRYLLIRCPFVTRLLGNITLSDIRSQLY